MDDIYEMYMEEVRGKHLISRTKEKALSEVIQSGGPGKRDAVNELVEANLRLVVKLAKEFPRGDLSLMDLIQEGNAGLIEAAENYDWRYGRFTTYATYLIKQHIFEGLRKYGRNVHIPANKIPIFYKYKRYCEWCLEREGYEPSVDEFIEKFKINKNGAGKFLLQYSGRIATVRSEELGVRSVPIEEIGADQEFSGDREMELKVDMPLYLDIIENQLVESGVLNKMEHEFLMCHYGLSDEKLSKLLKKYGKSLCTARKMNSRSIDKIRKSEFKDILKEFLEY